VASNPIWVVIPAAGESRRFKEAGYSTPKPLLRIRYNDTVSYMAHYVMSSIPLIHCETLIVFPYGVEIPHNFDHTAGRMFLKSTTGQADTVYQAIKELPKNDSVLILDCDMVLQSEDVYKLVLILQIEDVAIAVAETFDPNASRVDQIPYPTRFVEKENISQYGIVGARAFKNIGILQEALSRTLERYEVLGKEPYLSVAINHYPGNKYAHLITNYVDWGTPERIKESGAEIV